MNGLDFSGMEWNEVENMNSGDMCTEDNFTHCLASVNKRLMMLGCIQRPLGFDTRKDHVEIVNSLFRMLGQRQEDIRFRDELTDKLSRVQCDLSNVSNLYKKCKQKLDHEKRSKTQESLKYKSASKASKKEFQSLTAMLNKEKLESQHLRQKQVQFEHKLHRQEIQIERLKDRLTKMAQNKAGSFWKFSVVNELAKEDCREHWKHGHARNENTLYQNVVAAYEDEKSEILSENTALRESFKDLNEQLNQLRRIVYVKEGIVKFESNVTELNNGQFSLPFSLGREEIESSLKEKVLEIEKLMKQFQKTKDDENIAIKKLEKLLVNHIDDINSSQKAQKIVKQLQDRLNKLQAVVNEQTRLLNLDVKQPTHPMETNNFNEEEIMEQRRFVLDQRQRELEAKAEALDRKEIQLEADRQRLEVALQNSSLNTTADELLGI